MNAYRYEIEPRPAALGGGVRLYLYGPDQQTCEEIELGGGVFTSGPEEAEIKEGVCRGSVGRGFLARLAALLLKATLSAVNCFWSFARHAYFLVNIMQSIFSVAARRGTLLGDTANAERRAGALKMDWTEPLHDARPMCIEWLAEG